MYKHTVPFITAKSFLANFEFIVRYCVKWEIQFHFKREIYNYIFLSRVKTIWSVLNNMIIKYRILDIGWYEHWYTMLIKRVIVWSICEIVLMCLLKNHKIWDHLGMVQSSLYKHFVFHRKNEWNSVGQRHLCKSIFNFFITLLLNT